MEQPKNTTDAKVAGAGTAAMVPEGKSWSNPSLHYSPTTIEH